MAVTYEIFNLPQNPHLPDTFTLDHNRLSSLAAFRKTRYSDRLFYTDAQAELNILISTLVASRNTPKAAFKEESPDFRVILETDQEVYIEITTAIATSEARADGVVADLSFAISNWSRTNAREQERLAGYAITFFMPTPPSAKFTDLALAEMQSFLQTTDLNALSKRGIIAVGPGYPTLSKGEVKVLALNHGVSFVQVTRGAMAVEAPGDATRLIHDAIERKRGIAARWSVRPLWLIVWISGQYYHPDEMLAKLKLHHDTFEPFDRIYVGGATKLLQISNDGAKPLAVG